MRKEISMPCTEMRREERMRLLRSSLWYLLALDVVVLAAFVGSWWMSGLGLATFIYLLLSISGHFFVCRGLRHSEELYRYERVWSDAE